MTDGQNGSILEVEVRTVYKGGIQRYRKVVKACSDVFTKAKAQLKMKFVKRLKGNWKNLYIYMKD